MTSKNRVRCIMTWAADVFLIVTALTAVVFGVTEFFGISDILPQEKTLALITGLLGLTIAGILIDRRIELVGIRKLLEKDIQFEYLADTAAMVRELTSIVSDAEEFVFAIGAKSMAKEYLDEIASKVEKKKIQYRRLVTGDHITLDLYNHLISVTSQADTNVKIAWNKNEKYGLVTITEKGVIVALPSPYEQKFAGIELVGDHNARLYSQYFVEAFSRSVEIVSKDGLECLVEGSKHGTARNAAKIDEFLMKELEKTRGK